MIQRAAAHVLRLARLLVPPPVARRLAARRTDRLQRDPAWIADARAHMAHLGVPATGLDAAAADYLAFWTSVGELRWRPDTVTRQPVVGIEHLVAAHAQGRGVVLSFVHHGHYDGRFASLARTGPAVRVLVGAKELAGGGPSMIQHLGIVGSGGGLMPSTVGLDGIVEVLRQGEVLAVATDVPGSSVVELAGRRVRCSSGAVRGALEAGSPIVAVTSRRTEDGAELVVHPAIEPRGEVQDLLEQVVRIHEVAILAWPAAAFVPRLCWAPVEPT